MAAQKFRWMDLLLAPSTIGANFFRFLNVNLDKILATSCDHSRRRRRRSHHLFCS